MRRIGGLDFESFETRFSNRWGEMVKLEQAVLFGHLSGDITTKVKGLARIKEYAWHNRFWIDSAKPAGSYAGCTRGPDKLEINTVPGTFFPTSGV